MLILHICLRMLAGSRHMHLSIMVTLCQSKVEPWLIDSIRPPPPFGSSFCYFSQGCLYRVSEKNESK
jgi:hypothetical protein